MKIENKEQFNEYVDTLNRRGTKFNFDCCEIILLNSAMLVQDKKHCEAFSRGYKNGRLLLAL